MTRNVVEEGKDNAKGTFTRKWCGVGLSERDSLEGIILKDFGLEKAMERRSSCSRP